MNKKIGIISHYYNSTNYGGLLQAFALCRCVNESGIKAEQLCYDSSNRERSVIIRIKRSIKLVFDKIILLKHYKSYKCIKQRIRSIKNFRDSIPHSNFVFSDSTIYKANDMYDAFIVGSDQVWNPRLFRNVYSLLFTNKMKFSYAASLAVESVDSNQLMNYQKALSDYIYVSVRERSALNILRFYPNVQLCLDPVFLLTSEQWSEICESNIINEKYVFAYLLGDNLVSRQEAEKYAAKLGLKLVCIPYLLNKYKKSDDNFGDIQICDVSPQHFLSLIKYSECVFTDSFHAVCFSYIFKKNFYVFKRDVSGSMNTRITDILETLELKDRYVDFVDNPTNIDYRIIPVSKLECLKTSSESFLRDIVEFVKKQNEMDESYD